MGSTHHMFRRDHANMGDFFDPYAVHVLWTRGLPSYGIDGPPHEVDRGLRIRPVLLGVCLLSQVRRMDFLRWAGRGVSLRPRGGRVSGSLLGGSLGGPSAAFCGYASWLAWWWISGASMGIPSSLLSISGVMRRIALHLDASPGFVGLRLRGL
jgi:hypothetical protein